MVYATMTKDQNGLVNGCLLTWLMWLVSVAYGNWLAYKQRNNAKPLDRSGKIVQAEVLEAYPYWSSRAEADYLVKYHLHAYLNPSNTTHRTNSKECVYFLADKLKTIDVKVLLDHPEGCWRRKSNVLRLFYGSYQSRSPFRVGYLHFGGINDFSAKS